MAIVEWGVPFIYDLWNDIMVEAIIGSEVRSAAIHKLACKFDIF